MVWSCLHEGLIPIVIEKEQCGRYINALNRNDTKELTALALSIQEKESERMKLFSV